jgi:hypothetical protein
MTDEIKAQIEAKIAANSCSKDERKEFEKLLKASKKSDKFCNKIADLGKKENLSPEIKKEIEDLIATKSCSKEQFKDLKKRAKSSSKLNKKELKEKAKAAFSQCMASQNDKSLCNREKQRILKATNLEELAALETKWVKQDDKATVKKSFKECLKTSKTRKECRAERSELRAAKLTEVQKKSCINLLDTIVKKRNLNDQSALDADEIKLLMDKGCIQL